MSLLSEEIVNQKFIADLAHALRSSSSAIELRNTVFGYLERLGGKCPTRNCPHKLDLDPFVCLGYTTIHFVLGFDDEDLLLYRKNCGNPLVQEIFCNKFSEGSDEERGTCIHCALTNFSKRKKINGAFCHGCGFFVDLDSRTIGYAEEWTTRHELAVGVFVPGKPEGCSRCGTRKVVCKFGDYYFCSRDCMNEWYHGQMDFTHSF